MAALPGSRPAAPSVVPTAAERHEAASGPAGLHTDRVTHSEAQSVTVNPTVMCDTLLSP